MTASSFLGMLVTFSLIKCWETWVVYIPRKSKYILSCGGSVHFFGGRVCAVWSATLKVLWQPKTPMSDTAFATTISKKHGMLNGQTRNGYAICELSHPHLHPGIKSKFGMDTAELSPKWERGISGSATFCASAHADTTTKRNGMSYRTAHSITIYDHQLRWSRGGLIDWLKFFLHFFFWRAVRWQVGGCPANYRKLNSS